MRFRSSLSARGSGSAIAAAALFAVGLATSQPAAAAGVFGDPQVGEPAPSFTGVTSTGETIALEDLRGKTVVLEWTNHDCPYVVKHYGSGNMQALQKEAADDGVVWISVISSAPGTQGHVDAETANGLTASRDAAPAHVVLDPEGEIGSAYDARVTPHMYVIDGDGTLVYMGGIDDRPSTRPESLEGANNHVRAALTALAEGRAVDPAVTRAYGCSIKYGS